MTAISVGIVSNWVVSSSNLLSKERALGKQKLSRSFPCLARRWDRGIDFKLALAGLASARPHLVSAFVLVTLLRDV